MRGKASAIIEEIGEVPEWTIGAVSKTVVVLVATVGSNPTLSAGYKIPPRQLRLHLLPDLIFWW